VSSGPSREHSTRTHTRTLRVIESTRQAQKQQQLFLKQMTNLRRRGRTQLTKYPHTSAASLASSTSARARDSTDEILQSLVQNQFAHILRRAPANCIIHLVK